MNGHGGWLNFVRHLGGLSAREREVLVRHGGFLGMLERTNMTRSYKMLVLKTMQQAGELPGEISIASLTEGVRRLVSQNPVYARDISVPIDNQPALRRLIEDNPIRAWTTEGQRSDTYFRYRDAQFATTFTVSDADRPVLNDLARELIDWRLANYLDRSVFEEAGEEPPPFALAAEDQARWTGPELWREYMREEIPGLYGMRFSTGSWNQGIVIKGQHVFLLVTLQKEDFIQDHRYDDGFISASRMRWHSQNQTTPQSKHGRILSGAEPGYAIHLFVRATKKRSQMAAPFIYCGDLEFQAWSGSQPITVEWRLTSPIPDHLRRIFEVPTP
jgi:hypothetical protein